jgi:predicted GIY-YIG superfamily endonuclease
VNETFSGLVEKMPLLLDNLLNCPPHTAISILSKNVSKSGVYLFTDGDEHLYVGRTNRLRARYREHCSGTKNDAPFAFKLARIATENFKGNGKTRRELEQDPAFAKAFKTAKELVGKMAFRWVAISDPNEQCLFEIYATLALNAKHNDFENH